MTEGFIEAWNDAIDNDPTWQLLELLDDIKDEEGTDVMEAVRGEIDRQNLVYGLVKKRCGL